jgi:hypothetical protein
VTMTPAAEIKALTRPRCGDRAGSTSSSCTRDAVSARLAWLRPAPTRT